MVADTYSPSLGAIEQGTGNNNNSWGVNLNNALTALDKGSAGYVTYAVTGGNLAKDGVIPPAGEHPLVQMVVNFTGVLASDQTVTVPNVSKIWLVENGCTGAFTLKFKTTAGAASVAIPQNGMAIVICDGNNAMFVGLSSALRDVQWLGADGTIALPGVSFASQPTLGLRRVSAGVMAFTVGGVDVLTISGTSVSIAATASFSVVPSGSEMDTCAIRAPTGWYLEYGQAVTRAGDAALLAAITETFTATTNNTTTLSAVSADLRNLGLEGSVLEGVGIATGATIVSITVNTIVMSLAATNSAAGGSVRAFPYGNGDGSSTFNIPDARGTAAFGLGNMGGTDVAKLTPTYAGVGTALKTIGGFQSHTLDVTEMPAHAHGYSDPGHTHQQENAATKPAFGSNPNNPAWAGLAFTNVSTGFIGITISNTGGGLPHTITPPFRIRNVLIKR